MNSDQLSVQKPEYEEMALAIAEQRLRGYYDAVLWDELVGLRVIKGNKVDHPRKGSNDVADAVCGAVWNTVNHAKKVGMKIVDVRPLGMTPAKQAEEIVPDKRGTMMTPTPKKIQDVLDRMKMV